MEEIYKEALCRFCHISEIVMGIKENNTQDFKEIEELINEAKVARKVLKCFHIETFKKIQEIYGKLEALQWKQNTEYNELVKTINNTIENLYQKVYIIGKNKVKNIIFHVEFGKITETQGKQELKKLKLILKSILGDINDRSNRRYTYFVHFLSEKTDSGISFYNIFKEL